MARDPKPWYRKQTGWWMAVVDGVRHQLVKGPKDPSHREEAKRRLREIQTVHDKAPSLDSRDLTVRKAAGISDDAKLYGLRHGFGTRAVLNGVDIKTLSELLGPTTTKMSEHYLHIAGQTPHLARAIEKINRSTLLGSSTPPGARTNRDSAIGLSFELFLG